MFYAFPVFQITQKQGYGVERQSVQRNDTRALCLEVLFVQHRAHHAFLFSEQF